MRTRNGGTPKTPSPAKKTLVTKKKTPTTSKSAAKTRSSTRHPPPSAGESTPELATPASEPVSTPSIEPVSGPASNSTHTTDSEPVASVATEPVSEPAGNSTATPVSEPVGTVSIEPVATVATESAGNSTTTPVSEPVATVATVPVSEPVVIVATEPDVEQEKPSADDAAVARPTKVAAATEKKVTKIRKVTKVRRLKTPASAKAESPPAAKVGEAEDVEGDQCQKDDDMTDPKDEWSLKAEEVVLKATESDAQEDVGSARVEDLGDAQGEGIHKMDDDLSTVDARITEIMESPVAEDVAKFVEEAGKSIERQEEVECTEPVEEIQADEMLEPEKERQDQLDTMDDDQNLENTVDIQNSQQVDDGYTEKAESCQLKEDDGHTSDRIGEYADEEGFVKPGEEDLHEGDEPETADDVKASNEENKELAVAAKDRKIKKELEIFVDGLGLEVVEEEVKTAFEKAGEVVEVRLLKHPSTNKNRGFAFVRFATKDQAKKALSEMKNPVICGKQCGTEPNVEKDTLFVGNICNTWTKEAIHQKLKDYNIEGAESITLVQEPRHEGLSRGFCFIQFACHADAMSAYERLLKPDAVFGNAEKTAKVAFAEPLQEPDPEVMAKVKSVFIDGLPPYWDEDRVRKLFKNFGVIERVTLARNMPTAKRKDFGFVDYTTHEAAIACIEDVNKKDFCDGNSKTKVRARLSNPSPKMQVVKGAMRGGLQIGRPTGRSLGRPGPPVVRPNYQYNRVPHGPFNDPVGSHVRRATHRGAYGRPTASAVRRPDFGGPRHVLIGHGPVSPILLHREPFPLNDGGYSRPFMGRQYDDPYMYGDSHGLKRPFYMTEQDPAYMEPRQVRVRFDYTGLGRGSHGLGRGSHSRDTSGTGGSSMYPSGHYCTDYGAQPHSSFSAQDRSYRGGRSSRGGGSGYYY